MSNKPDNLTMLFQINAVTNFSDDYLLSLSEEQLERLYEDKVEKKR